MSILDSKDSSLKEEEEQQKNDQEFDFVSRKIPINEGELEKYILAVLKKAEENVQKTKLQEMLDKKDRFDKFVQKSFPVKEVNTAFVKSRTKDILLSRTIKANVYATDFENNVDYIISCPLCDTSIRTFDKEQGIYRFDPKEVARQINCPSCKRTIKQVFYTYFETHDPNSDWTKELEQLKEKKPNDIEIIREAIKSVKSNLPPCGILNCNGGCDDFRHIVDSKSLTTKPDSNNIQKTEKKWLNIGLAGFGLFSIFEILKYFFF